MTGNEIRAAGGVLWRPAGNDVEVALVHRPRYDDWSIPKGKRIAGESDLEAALREVREESGCEVDRLGRSLGEIRYLKPCGDFDLPKVVSYWAMRAGSGEFAPTQEVDEVRWLAPHEALGLLSTATDRTVLRRFLAHPPETGMVLLVRHASAGIRSRWKGDDRLRLLDRQGHEQAERLTQLIGRFDIEEIYSADYVRCLQTVEPLSGLVDVPIIQESLFSEDGYPGNEAKATEFVRDLSEHTGTAVVSTQGEVVPDIVQRLADEEGLGRIEPYEAEKASVWALSFHARNFLGADYLPPPAAPSEVPLR